MKRYLQRLKLSIFFRSSPNLCLYLCDGRLLMAVSPESDQKYRVSTQRSCRVRPASRSFLPTFVLLCLNNLFILLLHPLAPAPTDKETLEELFCNPEAKRSIELRL